MESGDSDMHLVVPPSLFELVLDTDKRAHDLTLHPPSSITKLHLASVNVQPLAFLSGLSAVQDLLLFNINEVAHAPVSLTGLTALKQNNLFVKPTTSFLPTSLTSLLFLNHRV